MIADHDVESCHSVTLLELGDVLADLGDASSDIISRVVGLSDKRGN